MAHRPSPNRVRRDPTLAREAYYRALEARNPNESQRSWRRTRFELGLRLASELERVHISTVENLEILDMGMGFGGDCSSLTSQGAHMTGLDSVDLGMKPLQDAFRDLASIRTVRAELNSPLPFSDGSFDGILSIDSLEHVRDLELFFGECGRILRPWGWIIVATPLAFRRIYHDSHFEFPGISLLRVPENLWPNPGRTSRALGHPPARPGLHLLQSELTTSRSDAAGSAFAEAESASMNRRPRKPRATISATPPTLPRAGTSLAGACTNGPSIS